jgi:FKBP-type peptidyl-prolyl cis-trans isomerase FkpA
MTFPLFRRLLPVLLLPAFAFAAEPATPPPASFPLEAYSAIGSKLAENSGLPRLGWNEAQFNAFVEGLRAAFQGKPYPVTPEARALHAEIDRQLQQLASRPAPGAGDGYAETVAISEKIIQDITKQAHLQRTDSGLAYSLAPQGVGPRPAPEDTVIISYLATKIDGQTEIPGVTAMHTRVKVRDLIPGLAEAVQLLVEGTSGRFVLAPDLSFGRGEWPAGADRGAPMVVTVQLEQIIPAP